MCVWQYTSLTEVIRRPWWRYAGAPVAIAAALLLMAGLIAVQRGTDTTVPAGQEVAQAGEDAAGSASETMAQGASEPAADWSGSAWIMAGARKAERPATETEDLLVALAEIAWFDSSAAYADDGRAIDTVFAAVYDKQPEAVLEALTIYARSGDTR